MTLLFTTSNAPKAIWPYSKTVKSWNLVFCSWQIALNPKTMELVEWWAKEQTKQVCENLSNVLREENLLKLENVIKTTIFLNNMDDFEVINKIYGEYFSHKPARSTVEVSRLPKNALVEIEVIAEIK